MANAWERQWQSTQYILAAVKNASWDLKLRDCYRHCSCVPVNKVSYHSTSQDLLPSYFTQKINKHREHRGGPRADHTHAQHPQLTKRLAFLSTRYPRFRIVEQSIGSAPDSAHAVAFKIKTSAERRTRQTTKSRTSKKNVLWRCREKDN